MAKQFLDSLLVLGRSFFNNPAFQRPAKIQHGSIVQCFATNQDRFLDQFAGHHIQRPAHIAVNHVTFAIGTGYGASRGTQVYADAESLVVSSIGQLPFLSEPLRLFA